MIKSKSKLLAGVAAVAACAGVSVANAADTSGQAQASSQVNRASSSVVSHPAVFPTGISLFAPGGIGADWGTVFAGGTLVNAWPGDDTSDGSFAFGAGFGDGNRTVGVTASVLVDSLGYRRPLAKNGAIALKAFRWVTSSTAVAIGAGNIHGWGVLDDKAKNYYGSVTQYFKVPYNLDLPVAVTIGAGTGSYVSVHDFRNDNDDRARGFGSVAVNVIPRASIIADYTSQVYSAGVSATPFKQVPVSVTAYATNLGGAHKRDGSATYGLRLAYGFSFK